MLTERQRKILGILQSNVEGITSDNMARLCGVSSKTVRTDIKILGHELNNIAIIHASTRKGYSLEIISPHELVNILVETADPLQDVALRSEYMLKELLKHTLRGEAMKQQEMADMLYVGLSTLKLHLKTVKEALDKYHLKITNYKNQGMLIDGDERNIRHAIYKYLFKNVEERWEMRQIFPEKYDMTIIRRLIINTTTAYNKILTDDSLEKIVDYLLISLYRADLGCNVTFRLQESRAIEGNHEYAMAAMIFENIYKELHIDVVTSEIYYFTNLLISSKTYNAALSEDESEHVALVGRMLDRVQRIVGINFHEDEVLKKGLVVHLTSVIHRIRLHMNFKNEVLDVVKNEYPLAFQVGIIACKIIEEEEGLPVSEDEIGFVAVHFGAALTRMNIHSGNQQKHVLLVCGSGMGTAILIKARLEEQFKNIMVIDKVLPGYQLADENLDNVDLIISTMPRTALPEIAIEHRDKLVVVCHFLNEVEKDIIKDKLFSVKKVSSGQIERFFSRELFFIDKKFTTKEQVLEFMTKSMAELGVMDKAAAQSVMEREEASPTEIGNLLAIPHPLENATQVSAVSVVILDKPIMWTEHHVQAIFLLSVAKEEFYLWEPLFLKLFDYLVKGRGIKGMIDHPDYDLFIKDFRKTF